MRFRDQLCKQGNSSKRIVIRLNSLDEQHSEADMILLGIDIVIDIDIVRSKMIFCAILCAILTYMCIILSTNYHLYLFNRKSKL